MILTDGNTLLETVNRRSITPINHASSVVLSEGLSPHLHLSLFFIQKVSVGIGLFSLSSLPLPLPHFQLVGKAARVLVEGNVPSLYSAGRRRQSGSGFVVGIGVGGLYLLEGESGSGVWLEAASEEVHRFY
jgi:hypothetical protein